MCGVSSMNIDKIKDKVDLCIGKEMNFRFNGSRNQIEEFIGYIDNLYPNVFTIRVCDNNRIKSFSYNDVLIHKLVFKSVKFYK